MSGGLAIAAVSAVLRQLLDDGLSKTDLSFLGTAHDVTAQPLDSLSIGQLDESLHLNLFLFEITPNNGWRNANLPSRSGSGERISNPPLALDLHYLLTACGKERYQAETLLGCGMQVLHESPFFSRDYIKRTLPSDMSGAGLAEQVEQIRICPQALSTDEMSKLWTIIGAKYRPSVAYLVSVVLIQSETETRRPLPVLSIGKEGRGVRVQLSLIPPYPTIERIDLAERRISALPGDTVTIVGHHFTEDAEGPLAISKVTLRLSHPRLPEPIDREVPSGQYTNTQITVSLPGGANQFPAGVYSLSLLITPHDPKLSVRTTNAFSLYVAPRILTINGKTLQPPPNLLQVQRTNIKKDLGDLVLDLSYEPPILPEQQAVLVLGDRAVKADPRPAGTGPLKFTYKELRAETYRLCLRVDGVDSLLIDRSDERHAKFDESQQLVVT